MFNAKQIIGVESTPTTDGECLARHIIKHADQKASIQVDVRELAPEDLVSSFVNAFLHTLEQAKWPQARLKSVRWIAKFDGESERLRELALLYFTAPKSAKRSASMGANKQ